MKHIPLPWPSYHAPSRWFVQEMLEPDETLASNDLEFIYLIVLRRFPKWSTPASRTERRARSRSVLCSVLNVLAARIEGCGTVAYIESESALGWGD